MKNEILSAADQALLADQPLLDKINVAVAAVNEAEKTATTVQAELTTAQAELVSRSRTLGELLIEAKMRHPAVKDFEAFLKRVDGLKLSRAYDLMRLAGGRTTDEELRQETRDRVRKHRAKKKTPKPEPVSVTDADVTESPKQIPTSDRVMQSPEISAEQRKAEMAALDSNVEEAAKASADYLAEFRAACLDLLPKITDYADQMKALMFVQDTLKRLREEAKHKRRAA